MEVIDKQFWNHKTFHHLQRQSRQHQKTSPSYGRHRRTTPIIEALPLALNHHILHKKISLQRITTVSNTNRLTHLNFVEL